jgi:hypothetical protein
MTKEAFSTDSLRERIKLEINQFKVNIDKSVFIKTTTEKLALKKAKLQSRVYNKSLRNECIKSILDSTPHFGSLKLGIL